VSDQAAAFLSSSGGMAPSDALYVVEGGGNDAREFLPALLQGADPSSMIAAYASSMVSIISALALAGADHFLLWNVPDIGQIPLVTTLGAGPSAAAHNLAELMNRALLQGLAGLSSDIVDGIHLFDAFGALGAISANPGAFGFTNGTDACALDPVCIADPSGYFFWDGLHPTTAGHAVIAQLAQQLMPAEVPEPETLLLLVVGVFGLVATRRRASVTETLPAG
jgi:outer membrane lipase/esterase